MSPCLRALLLLAAVLLAAGCAARPAVLEGAINPDKLPVYVPATLDKDQAIAGADMEGDEGAFYARYWDLKTDDPPEKVVEFYRKALPAAKEDKREARTVFTWMPFPGAEPGEYIQVSVEKEKGKIHISECLKKGKHKK